jgi:hypothetical protein
MGIFHSCNAEYEDVQNRAFAKSLREKGHTCVHIFDFYPVRVNWCQQEPCTYGDDNDTHMVVY